MDALIEWFSALPSFWLWLMAGLITMVCELILPGVYLLWLGFAALCVSLITCVFDLSIISQVISFAAFTTFFIFSAVYYFKRSSISSDDIFLNERMKGYIGQQVILHTSITNGTGRIYIDDTFWVVEGAELPEGTLCTITGIKGMRFLVIRVGD